MWDLHRKVSPERKTRQGFDGRGRCIAVSGNPEGSVGMPGPSQATPG